MKVAVLGAGESGTGAALLARRLGAEPFVSDIKEIKAEYKAVLQSKGIDFEEGYHTESKIFDAELIIKSPGIPDGIDIVKRLREAGKEIIDEIEYGFRALTKGKVMAITGTNGKTTTTRLLHTLLVDAGLDAALGGNIGRSFAGLLAEEPEHDWYVLEVSSFQLDGCSTFAPQVSVITNITPDHLDRYQYKMENYVASKFRIAQSQYEEDHFIVNSENEEIANYLKSWTPKAALHEVSGKEIEGAEELNINGTVVLKKSLNLLGKHNYHNIACAVTAAQIIGISDESILKTLSEFKADPHRMEPIATINGVSYINDSKATNVDSVWYALDAMTTPTVWIAGGTDKGNDYEVLMPLVKGRVKALICMTTDPGKLQETFKWDIPVIETAQSAKEAVQLAAKFAESGDTVLLSPACASFDLFKNYGDRGDQFRAAVLDL